MKIRTAKYIIKDGVVNIYKNKLMSLASISTVIASLLLFGVFLLIAVNLEYNTKTLEQLPQMQVYCDYELDEFQVKKVEEAIKANDRVKECTMVTKKEAFEKLKELFADDSSTLEGYDESFLPVSFKIKLVDARESNEIKAELESISGVDSVECPQKTIDVISKFAYWVKIVSGFLIALLVVISVFIISNTIKLTVFARRKEISIMKYIGATDWFIRWPFIVEGVIIGLIGALIAFALTSYGYGALEVKYSGELTRLSLGFLKLIKPGQISFAMVVLYVFLGGTVGAVGSIISMRKYLRA